MVDTSASVALASAIGVASVAGSISIFNLLVNKDQKISEYRQQWLEDVRSDVASLVAQAHQLFGYLNLLIGDANSKTLFLEKTDPIYDEINRASTRLKLRLNVSKPEHRAIAKQIKALEDLLADVDTFRAHLLSAGSVQVSKEVNATTDALVTAASILISSTWKRVKAGEPTYRKGKWLILILTSLFIILLAGAFWLNARSNAASTSPNLAPHAQPIRSP
jgi:hypothetical protein